MPPARGKTGTKRRRRPSPAAAPEEQERTRKENSDPRKDSQSRSSKRQTEPSQLEDDSVIMLPSAENTIVTVEDDPSELLMVSGTSEMLRPSTRLTDMDMMLEDTGSSTPRHSGNSFTGGDATDMDVVNIDQTTMIERNRPKSSFFPRQSRSRSLAPIPVPEQQQHEANTHAIRRSRSRSSVFSMVTKRGRRRPAERRVSSNVALEEIDEEPPQIVVETPKRPVPPDVGHELVISTRSQLREREQAKRVRTRSASRGRAESGKRKEKGKKGKGTEGQKASATANQVSSRRKRGRDKTPSSSGLALDDNQNVSSTSIGQTRLEKSTAEIVSERSNSIRIEAQNERSEEIPRKPTEEIPTSNVSKRKRPKPTLDKSTSQSQLPQLEKSTTTPIVSTEEHSAVRSSSRARKPTWKLLSSAKNAPSAPQSPSQEAVAKRPRTRSASRGRQPVPALTARSRAKSVSRGSSSQSEVPKAPETALESPSATAAMVTQRHRTKSVPRVNHPDPEIDQTPPEEAPSPAPQMVTQRPRGRARLRAVSESINPNSPSSRAKSSSRIEQQSPPKPPEVAPQESPPPAVMVTQRPRTKSGPRVCQPDLEITQEPPAAASPPPETVAKRPRTKSVPRSSQPDSQTAQEPPEVPSPLPETVTQRPRGRARKRAVSESVKATPTLARGKSSTRVSQQSPPKPPEPVQESPKLPEMVTQRPRGRARKRAVSESANAKITPARGKSSPRVSQQSPPKPPDPVQESPKAPEMVTQRPGRAGRSRKRAISESVNAVSVTPKSTRSRSKSSNQHQRPPSRNRRSRSKVATKSPAKQQQPSRGRSVPRDVLLSPPAPTSTSKSSSSVSHIPIYRRYAEEVLQLTTQQQQPSVDKSTSLLIPPPEPAALGSDEDIYAFNSSQNGGATASSASTSKKRRRPKSALGNVSSASTSSSRGRRITPVKRAHHSVFGTDMTKISSVVKKIGGGPVRRVDDSGLGSSTAGPMSSAAKTTTVSTSTLAALVHPTNPSHIQSTTAPRSASPVSNYDTADDHHFNDDDRDHQAFDVENIPAVEVPAPLSPPRLHPRVQQVLQQKVTNIPNIPSSTTLDKTQPNASLNFSPLGASSPWRVQNENFLPKTFYFSRSKDLLPSYESDLVVRDVDTHPPHSSAASPADVHSFVAPAPPRKTSPTRPGPSTSSSASNVEAQFQDIKKSYEQLKATSEMSVKLIAAMRQYKAHVHNQTTSFSSENSQQDAEQLIAKFHEYEENMKKTYAKLKQWYERSQKTLARSRRTIDQVASAPKTQAQQEVLENFNRQSERFATMIGELESAMNDSNIENISPPKAPQQQDGDGGRPPFRDVILTDRDLSNRNRSPLKALNVLNVPQRFSPVKSPLVKASFSSFSTSDKRNSLPKSRELFSRMSLVRPAVTTTTQQRESSEAPNQSSVIEIGDTLAEEANQPSETEKQPSKDLFGFESDVDEDEPVEPTPMKITRETLKERLQTVRKLLPPTLRTYGSAAKSSSMTSSSSQLPRIFHSPSKTRSIQSVFSSSTPLAEKRKQAKPKQPEADPNISAIGTSTAAQPIPTEAPVQETAVAATEPQQQRSSPPAAVFTEPEEEFYSTSFNGNRTYSREPRRNPKRKRNVYLLHLGLSDDEEEDEEVEPVDDSDASDDDEGQGKKAKRRKKQQQQQKSKKKQPATQEPSRKKKKKPIEESTEFQKFVSDFNSMCEEVNRYQLVVDKPAPVGQR